MTETYLLMVDLTYNAIQLYMTLHHLQDNLSGNLVPPGAQELLGSFVKIKIYFVET